MAAEEKGKAVREHATRLAESVAASTKLHMAWATHIEARIVSLEGELALLREGRASPAEPSTDAPPVFQICLACNGIGQIEADCDWAPCRKCGGEGRITGGDSPRAPRPR